MYFRLNLRAKNSARQTKMPASPSFFQGVTIAKFRPHLWYTVAKNGSTAAALGSNTDQAACVFSPHAFSIVMQAFILHTLHSHLPSSLSSPAGLSFLSLLLQSQRSLCSLFAAKCVFKIVMLCLLPVMLLLLELRSNCLWPEAAVECRFIFPSHPSSLLPSLSLSLSLSLAYFWFALLPWF